jgi:hypothetical protein
MEIKPAAPVISIHDLLGLYAFLRLHHHPHAELRIYADRVFGTCSADALYNDLSERFNKNEVVPILTLLGIQRDIKGELQALKRASQYRGKNE